MSTIATRKTAMAVISQSDWPGCVMKTGRCVCCQHMQRWRGGVFHLTRTPMRRRNSLPQGVMHDR